MSGVTVRCSHCSAALKLKDRGKLGSKVNCSKCGKPFLMQASGTDVEWDSVPEYQTAGANALPPVQRRRSGNSRKPRKKRGTGMSGGLTGVLIGGCVLVIVTLIAGGIWVSGLLTAGRDEVVADAGVSGDGAASVTAVDSQGESSRQTPESALAQADSDKEPAESETPEVATTSAPGGFHVVNMTAGELQGEQIPNYLRGGTIYRRDIDETNLPSGLLEFEVDPNTPVYLQASWIDDPLEEIAEEVTTRDQLLAQGWISLGTCPWSEQDELFYAVATDGGSFEFRMNNYQPPWPIHAGVLNVIDPEKEPAIPNSAAQLLTGVAAYDHLMAEDYDWLDNTAELLRTRLSRHHSGYLKLDDFYEGLLHYYLGSEDADWDRREEQLTTWMGARPDSVTAKLALAQFLGQYAVRARGDGPASTVTEEGGRLYRQRNARAAELLTPLAERGIKDPLLYQQLIGCAIGLRWERERVDSYVSESLHIDPRFLDVLYSAAYYYLPRWYGEEDDVVQLADRAAELTREEFGLGAYAFVVDVVRPLHPKVFDDFEFSWEKTKQGYLDLMEQYPHDRSWYDRACLAAAAADDDAMVGEMLALIGDRPTASVWPPGNYFQRFVLSYSADAVSGEQQVLMRGDADAIEQLDISPDNARIVSGDARHRVFIHNVETGAKEAEMQFRDFPNAIACTPDPALIVIGDLHGQLNLFDFNSRRMRNIGSHEGRIIDVDVATDGSLIASASDSGMVCLWNGRSGDLRHTINVPARRAIHEMALSSDGETVAAVSDNGHAYLYSTGNGELETSWNVGIYPTMFVFSGDGTRLAVKSRIEPGVRSQTMITIWDIASQTQIAHTEPQRSIVSMAFHPSKEVLAVTGSYTSFGTEGGAYLWSYMLADETFVQLVGHDSGVHDCQFFPDGRLATCGTDGTVRIWETN